MPNGLFVAGSLRPAKEEALRNQQASSQWAPFLPLTCGVSQSYGMK